MSRFDYLVRVIMVRVGHWNVSTVDARPFGMTKYEDQIAAELRKMGVEIDQVRRRSNRMLGNTVASWLTRYRATGVDLVHATFQTIAPASLVHRISPFVVTVHDVAPLVYPTEVADLSTRIQWLFTPSALRRADRIIAISNFTKAEVQRLIDIPAADINVVHQGVNHDRYCPIDRAEARAHFDLDPGTQYILLVSSNLEHKRQADAIAVLRELRSELDDVKILKAGYGTELEEEGVVSTGWINEADMPKLYNAADVYLHTSEYEGFGLPILEAMACGTPVVAKAVASVPEIVGEQYDLAPKDASPVELATKVEKRLREPSAAIEEQSIERSREFTWQRTARETKSVYDEVLKE